MLCIKLKRGASVRIGQAIVKWDYHPGGGIQLFIDAPRNVTVIRDNAKKTQPREGQR